MKVREMTGLICDPRGDIEFDTEERDRYVVRLCKVMEADTTEDARADAVYDIHLELRTQHDLYIAVHDAIPSRYRSALREYVKQWKSR